MALLPTQRWYTFELFRLSIIELENEIDGFFPTLGPEVEILRSLELPRFFYSLLKEQQQNTSSFYQDNYAIISNSLELITYLIRYMQILNGIRSE